MSEEFNKQIASILMQIDGVKSVTNNGTRCLFICEDKLIAMDVFVSYGMIGLSVSELDNGCLVKGISKELENVYRKLFNDSMLKYVKDVQKIGNSLYLVEPLKNELLKVI